MKYTVRRISIERPDALSTKVFLHFFSKGFHASSPLMSITDAKKKLKQWKCKQKKNCYIPQTPLIAEVNLKTERND